MSANNRIKPPITPGEDRKIMKATHENMDDWLPLLKTGDYYLETLPNQGNWLMKFKEEAPK